MLPVQITDCEFTQTHVTLKQGLTFAEWLHVGNKLGHIHGCARWWIGDWMNYGEQHYGDKSRRAIEAAALLHLEPDACRSYALVASRVATRVSTLTWSHHREVVALEPDDQQSWLRLAEQHDWSVADLRQAIREDQADTRPDAGKPVRTFVGIATELLRGLRQRGEPSSLTASERERIKGELQPIVEYYQEL